MNININKDFEKEYKDDSWRGFSMQEVCCIGIALSMAAAVSMWFYYTYHVPLNTVIYTGVPPAIPLLVYGFYRYQGMNLLELIREVFEEKKSNKLCYEAGEAEKIREKSMDRGREKRSRKQRTVKRRRYKNPIWKGGNR